jgi:hypothetical protein
MGWPGSRAFGRVLGVAWEVVGPDPGASCNWRSLVAGAPSGQEQWANAERREVTSVPVHRIEPADRRLDRTIGDLMIEKGYVPRHVLTETRKVQQALMQRFLDLYEPKRQEWAKKTAEDEPGLPSPEQIFREAVRRARRPSVALAAAHTS